MEEFFIITPLGLEKSVYKELKLKWPLYFEQQYTANIVEGGIEAQTEQVMKNIGAILNAAELKYSDVVRAEVFLTNMDDFSKVNEIYVKYFSAEPKPARFAVSVASLPMQSLVEIAVIAKR